VTHHDHRDDRKEQEGQYQFGSQFHLSHPFALEFLSGLLRKYRFYVVARSAVSRSNRFESPCYMLSKKLFSTP
ncbi:MAG: hypothetical protein WC749_10675, partial [Dehalococcoidia bacterium]